MWTADRADLTCAKDARRAISSICIGENTRFVIRGKAGDNELGFAKGDPIRKLVTYQGGMETLTRWFAIGRQVTAIELVHSAN